MLQFVAGRPRVIPGALRAIKDLAAVVDVYLVTTLPVDSDALEAEAMAALTDAGVFGDCGCAAPHSRPRVRRDCSLPLAPRQLSSGATHTRRCDRRKVLFSSTEDGRCAMVRQLSPSTHIDTSPKVLQYVAPHVPRAVYVHAQRLPLPTPKGIIIPVASLAEYVALGHPPAAASGAAS